MLRFARLAAALLLFVGCAQARDDGSGMAGGISATSGFGVDDDASEDDDALDVGDRDTQGAGDEGGDCDPTSPNATLTGTVYAPNLEIPIGGAVVYWATGDPEPVPDEVYCSECVGVPCSSDFALTGPDGSFELPAVAGPNRRLIVAKGQFKRASEIDIDEGMNAIAPTDSSLPGEWKPGAGMWIPRIAVVNTEADSIYNILAKIGLGSVNGNGRLVSGSEQFDRLSQADGGALLDDIEWMRQYHIIFVPCMAQDGMGDLTEKRRQNIRQWVGEGGKFYVTDWANEYLYQSFPQYQEFHRQATDPDLEYYNTTGTVLDADLLAWLEALPPALKDVGGGLPNLNQLPQVGLHDNWSGLDMLPPVYAQNEDGEEVDVGHYAWVEGPCEECSPGGTRPMTISAEYGCGRMMFSTYHTNEEAHAGLSPQELILLYIILEIGVCHDEPPPQAPPEG